MITTILFDADGVLINGKQFSIELEKNYGISNEQTTPFFLQDFPDCLVGKADLKERLTPYLKDWGWSGSVDDLLNYWFETEHAINADLVAYIQDLKDAGITCVMATNQEKHRANYLVNEMGFKNVFDDLYASAHLGARKPDLLFFERILEKIGDPHKSEVLFWDDATSNVKAARTFGIHAEHYTTFEDFKEKMAINYF